MVSNLRADTRLRMGDTGGQHNRPLKAMSEEQLKAFLVAVKADAGLQEKLKASDADAVVEIAMAAGFGISAEEFQGDQAEVSEEELEGISGGMELSCAPNYYTCARSCIIG